MTILLSLILWSCGTSQPIVTTERRTTTKITKREIPVFTPEVSVTAHGKIRLNQQGKPEIGNLNVKSNSDSEIKPDISVSVDNEGNLDIGVTLPPQKTSVAVNDTTTNTETASTRYVEVGKDLSWWEETLIYIGGFVVLFLFIKFGFRLKRK